MPATYYPAVIDRSASGFGVTFPDFPGCIANGGSVSEACVQAERALAFHVEAMAKDGDAIPQPSDLGDIEDGPDDVARVVVRVDHPAKIARVLVSIDENLLRQIDAVASNRSAFMSDAARVVLSGSRVMMREMNEELAATKPTAPKAAKPAAPPIGYIGVEQAKSSFRAMS